MSSAAAMSTSAAACAGTTPLALACTAAVVSVSLTACSAAAAAVVVAAVAAAGASIGTSALSAALKAACMTALGGLPRFFFSLGTAASAPPGTGSAPGTASSATGTAAAFSPGCAALLAAATAGSFFFLGLVGLVEGSAKVSERLSSACWAFIRSTTSRPACAATWAMISASAASEAA